MCSESPTLKRKWRLTEQEDVHVYLWERQDGVSDNDNYCSAGDLEKAVCDQLELFVPKVLARFGLRSSKSGSRVSQTKKGSRNE